MPKFAKRQPQPGQGVGGCKHVVEPTAITGSWGDCHWFELGKGEGVTLSGIDPRTGSTVVRTKIHWLVCCNECFAKHLDDPTKIKIHRTSVWSSTDPIIQEGGN